jgi:hypothetical protein
MRDIYSHHAIHVEIVMKKLAFLKQFTEQFI